jgi:sterol desaturase/sphingolipid hydroxylase (fatty acid hydroxylase superfamily)
MSQTLLHLRSTSLLPHLLSHANAFAQTKLHGLETKILAFRLAEHLMVVATWGTFLVAAAVAFFMELKAERQSLSLRAFLSFCFPGAEWKSYSARTDIWLYVLSKIIDPLFGVAGFLLTGFLSFYLAEGLLAIGFAPRATKGGVVVAIVLGFVFFLANDFANYLTHLAEHQFPFLWEFHKVHHTATFLSPLTTAREHPVVKVFDDLVSGLFMGILIGFVKAYYGYSMVELMGILATANTFGTLIVLDSLRHSQFPISFGWFDKLLISPHMHQLHHSLKEAHWNKNMGNKLAIWDGAFKTVFIPVRGEALQYGSGSAEEDHEYRSALRCYVVPFIKNYRSVKASIQARKKQTLGKVEPVQKMDQHTEKQAIVRTGA